MYLLYLDESGHSHDPSSNFFVLAGFSVFERQTHWIEAAMNPIAARFNGANPASIEFHGSVMRAGREDWHGVSPADRVQALVDVLSLLGNQQLKLRVFASVIEKSLVPQDQILHQSFENLASEFDKYLNAMYLKKNPQRGLVVFDKTDYEEKLQALSQLFKHQGHANGKLRNFAEVPLFLDSKASRLIQLADLIAYWVFRYFQSGDDRGFKLIQPHFHQYGGVSHGLFQQVTQDTVTRLANLPPQQYPFPPPTPVPAPAVE